MRKDIAATITIWVPCKTDLSAYLGSAFQLAGQVFPEMTCDRAELKARFNQDRAFPEGHDLVVLFYTRK